MPMYIPQNLHNHEFQPTGLKECISLLFVKRHGSRAAYMMLPVMMGVVICEQLNASIYMFQFIHLFHQCRTATLAQSSSLTVADSFFQSYSLDNLTSLENGQM